MKLVSICVVIVCMVLLGLLSIGWICGLIIVLLNVYIVSSSIVVWIWDLWLGMCFLIVLMSVCIVMCIGLRCWVLLLSVIYVVSCFVLLFVNVLKI